MIIVLALSVLVLIVVSDALLESRTTTLGTVLRQLRLPPADLKCNRRRAEAACANKSPSLVLLLVPSLVLEPLPVVLVQFALWWLRCPRAGDDCDSPESAPLPLVLPPFAGEPRFVGEHPWITTKQEKKTIKLISQISLNIELKQGKVLSQNFNCVRDSQWLRNFRKKTSKIFSDLWNCEKHGSKRFSNFSFFLVPRNEYCYIFRSFFFFLRIFEETLFKKLLNVTSVPRVFVGISNGPRIRNFWH